MCSRQAWEKKRSSALSLCRPARLGLHYDDGCSCKEGIGVIWVEEKKEGPWTAQHVRVSENAGSLY